MKTQLLTILAVSTITLSSCYKNESPEPELQAINFNGKINNLQATINTGTPNTTWANNDEIGLFMVNRGTSGVTEGYSNRRFTYTAGQFAAVSGQEMYYPVSDSKVDFIAYYPFFPGGDINLPLMINVSNQSNPSSLDLLYAKSTNSGTGFNKTAGVNVPLEFNHMLSKIIIKPLAGNGFSNIDPSWTSMSVIINGLITQSSFNLNTGTLAPSSIVSGPIVPFTRAMGVSYEAIVIPSIYPAVGAVTFSFQLAGNSYVWKSQANETFEAGKEYTYTINVNKTGVTLGGLTINDWQNVSRSGVAN
ncbi:fimbrillin family protein [Sphingobacterium bovistauri]|uniref:Fimbrillin family protein n=1 Tax=Sphingobacterium bovistauri TaxID=2781959 RepID=A0ABS7Z7C2_9SPHI|nr:fimbrillin family protein [Sphingobacterium bovistauri]MCA5004765.1 fimbrillin family protein [Sphingobacterium bovistauri]